MLVAVVLIIELMAIFLCVHRIYGQKLKVDFASIVTFATMLIVMYAVNYFELSSVFSFALYLIILAFCKMKFKDRIIPALVTVILLIIIIAIIEFLYVVISSLFVWNDKNMRDLLGSIVTLLVVIFVIPFCRINKLRESVCRRHWFMYIILFFAIIVAFSTLIMVKTQEGVQLGFFIFGIPSVSIILFLVMYWDKSVMKEMQMKQQLSAIESMQNNYDDLLLKVKENQHGLKNHMMAVMSSHYAYKTYEQLVEAQKEYCGKIQEENKYNNLLLIGNHTLGGFLYGKMQEIESKGIDFTYKIETQVIDCYMPQYHLIEILGIMLDNAIEAVESDKGAIHICITRNQEGYKFIIENTYREIGYNEMSQWFELGETTKGEGRGIGLHQVIKLCDEWKGKITCKNQKKNQYNWIVFELQLCEK